MVKNIHHGQPVINIGTEVESARLIVILLHGRGSTVEGILPIAKNLKMEGVRFIIPQAGLNRWYPNTAFGPLEANEPDLSFALGLIDKLVQDAHEMGFSNQQIIFGGFSQGACLAAEYVVRNTKKYGGLFVFSGALIGPPGTLRSHPDSFEGMPVFIGGSDDDPWVTYDLLRDTASVFESMGASVDFQTYPGKAHTVNQDEIKQVRALLNKGNILEESSQKN